MRRPLVAGLGLLLAACGAVASPPAADPVNGQLLVFAAASLTESFTKVGADLHRLHPGLNVTYNFNGSSTLVAQIVQGAPADVFASADQANMDKVTAAGEASGTPQVFVKNRLEIVVQKGNPKHIAGLADLAQPGLLLVLAGPTVPAGKYALQAFQQAGVTVKPVSQETDVKSVVSKVALGEADAGVVYVTDVKAAGSTVAGVEIPDAQNVVATYPIVTARSATNLVAARAFIDYLRSDAGVATMESFGFQAP